MAENEELERAVEAAAALGCDAILLSSLANVTYVSGFEVPVPVGALAELAYGPALAVCSVREQASWLIVPNGNAAQAAEQSRLTHLLSFDTFDSFNATDSRASLLDHVQRALQDGGLQHRQATLGIEARTTPFAVTALLQERFPNLTLVEVDGALAQARRLKTAREIQLLRRAAAIADIAQNTLRDLVQEAGRSEFAMWVEITQRMFEAAGHPTPITGELVTGPRSAVVLYPNGPHPRRTEVGDAALMDISQRIDGYWSDVTNTYLVGAVAPAPLQQKLARASQAACEAAMDSLRPGKKASDAWAAAEAVFELFDLPAAHYAGHQIGVAVNELPRLVPYDHTPIEAGMVFSVEPGAYAGDGGTFGARAEKMVLVTASGPEILSQFEWGI